MKNIILMFIILSFTVLAQNEKRIVTIDKNNQGGFNFYSNSGELLSEYTKRNTDSLTLKALDDIYFDADSLNDTSKKSLSVNIENWPQNDSVIWQMLKVFIPTLAGIIFGWVLAFLPQRNQSIRSTYFQLLENQNKILENTSIDYSIGGKKTEIIGANFFVHIKNRMVEFYKLAKLDYNIDINQIHKKLLQERAEHLQDNFSNHFVITEFYKNRPKKKETDDEIEYERKLALYVFSFIFDTYQQNITNYFRHLFNIILYVDNSQFLLGKEKLINFLKAKMSDAELFILYYDGLKYSKMKKFIEKYHLIRNLRKRDLLNDNHEKFYIVSILQS